MKIKGNTVGTTMPRTDWEQENPKKANYLKGREKIIELINKAQTSANKAQSAADNAQTAADNAQTAADNAQTAADNAQTAADNAQNAADNAQTTADNAQAAADNALAESKTYADDKHKFFTVTLTVDGWTGEAAPYTQTIAVEGILETDTPHWGLVYSDAPEESGEEDALDLKLAEKENYNLVDDLDTADGSVTFTCFELKPEVALTIQMEVNR